MSKLYITLPLIILLSIGCSSMRAVEKGTNVVWVDILADKKLSSGKKYDFCYQFNLKFYPKPAMNAINFEDACISTCCWMSDKPTVKINLNETFEYRLAKYGRAYKYEPETITIKTKYNSFLKMFRVNAQPKIINSKGEVGLKYKLYENPERLAELEKQRKEAKALASTRTTERQAQYRRQKEQEQAGLLKMQAMYQENLAIEYVQRYVGPKIDKYLYELTKSYRNEGKLLFIDEKVWDIKKTEDSKYSVKCSVDSRLGKSANTMKAYSVYCGEWNVNTNTERVWPIDSRSLDIYNGVF